MVRAIRAEHVATTTGWKLRGDSVLPGGRRPPRDKANPGRCCHKTGHEATEGSQRGDCRAFDHISSAACRREYHDRPVARASPPARPAGRAGEPDLTQHDDASAIGASERNAIIAPAGLEKTVSETKLSAARGAGDSRRLPDEPPRTVRRRARLPGHRRSRIAARPKPRASERTSTCRLQLDRRSPRGSAADSTWRTRMAPSTLPRGRWKLPDVRA